MNISLPNRDNTCIVIVTFNPDEDFSNNITQHLKIVGQIVIVDNNSTKDIDLLIPQNNNILVIKSLTNKGIAWALNEGIKFAKNKKYKWVITFDQDSFPNENLLLFYSEVVLKEKKIGLLGTNFAENKISVENITWRNKLTVITSGTLHPIEIFDVADYYNEKLFIDAVDFDFALRVKNLGYKVIRIDQPLLSHKLGSPLKKYGLSSSNHNLIRRYYYSRNHVFLTRNYFFNFPFWIMKKNFFFIKNILLMIIVEENVSQKLHNMYKGIKDGCKVL